MADLADVQKALQQKREERLRHEEERRWLVQRDSKERKLASALDLATKRAKKVKTIDLCFVVDLTASMQCWLKMVHEKIDEIIEDNLKCLGDFARVRVAVVGYRDYADRDHLVVLPFTHNIQQIKKFLHGLKATGGGDATEDVLSGLEEALKLEWSSTARVLYLLSQTPHHGWRFHKALEVNSDRATLKEAVAASEVQDKEEAEAALATKFYDLHCEDPRQWAPMDHALQELQQQQVQLVMLRLGPTTEKMIQVFKQQYSVPGAAGLELKVYDARKDAKHLRCIVSSSSVATFSASASRMGQVPVDKHQKLLPYVVEQSEPDWDHRDEWCTVEAELYTYTIVDVDEKPVKSSCPFTAVLHPRPFGKGAMRFAFYLVDQGNPDSKYVGKVYQFEDPAFQQRSTYEGDMTSQAVAGYLAKEFSLQYVEDPIEFVQAQLLDLGAHSTFPFRFMAIEPFIPGKYEKFTSNAGHISKDSDLAQAFSHFTWEFTAGDIMVADIQGGGNTLTDPQIHSQDIDRFGRGNLATKGMNAFFLNHRCNHICHTLQLQGHPLQPGMAPEEAIALPLASIQEIAESPGAGPALEVDWMPLPDSKLRRFLDAVRNAAAAGSTGSTETASLGGAVIEWQERPKIVKVLPNSPASEAGCEEGVYLHLIGGQHITGELSKAEVLHLLAAENNMMVVMAAPEKVESILKKISGDEITVPMLELLKGLICGEPDGGASLLEFLAALSDEGALKPLQGGLEKEVAKMRLLEGLSSDAAHRLQHPDSSEGWNSQLNAPYDTLAGATFVWTNPPTIWAVMKGSIAEGQMSKGDTLISIDGEEVQGLSRQDVLEKLQKCQGIGLGRGKMTTSFDGFDAVSGLETSTWRGRKIIWTDPPSFEDDDILVETGGANFFGRPKQEVLAMLEASSQMTSLNIAKIRLAASVNFLKIGLQEKLEGDQQPVHLGFTCQGCERKPLIGARHTCKDCGVHLCGACFRGRAHAHVSGHCFLVHEHAGASASGAAPVIPLAEGSPVVVIGTGQKWDGQPGLATAPLSSEASSLWSVVMEGEDVCLELEAKHLFLREPQKTGDEAAPDLDKETETKAVEAPLPDLLAPLAAESPKSTTPAPKQTEARRPAPRATKSPKPATPAPKGTEPRFTKVQSKKVEDFTVQGLTRQRSARELRQAKGQEALERFKAAPRTAHKSTFLCKGKCGRMVETEKVDYIKKGQEGVFCELCTKKCKASRKQALCQKCRAGFVYFQFVLDLEGRAVPRLCDNCRDSQADGWAIVSPCPARAP
ncbi:Alpha-protein kinase 1 (AK1) [Durusdinium trenchii]|uniref:Alpha-protein kinase 1 (AK1) n=1 Tax=Durusdinium trenchii TaxID=1381693 RepID=A0ABP0N7L0_9DINO